MHWFVIIAVHVTLDKKVLISHRSKAENERKKTIKNENEAHVGLSAKRYRRGETGPPEQVYWRRMWSPVDVSLLIWRCHATQNSHRRTNTNCAQTDHENCARFYRIDEVIYILCSTINTLAAARSLCAFLVASIFIFDGCVCSVHAPIHLCTITTDGAFRFIRFGQIEECQHIWTSCETSSLNAFDCKM